MNINKTFKETMDYMRVKGSALAEVSGRSKNNISEIRNGKAHPSTEDFGKLLEHCETLAPGFTKEFGRRLSGRMTPFIFSPEEFISELDPSQLGALMFAIGSRISSLKNSDLVAS